MRLHALQSATKEAQPIETHRALLRQNVALDLTPRPELVIHAAPRLLRVGAEIRVPVFPDHEARRHLRELEIHDLGLVDGGFDGVAFAVFAQFHAAVLGVEVLLVFGEGEVREVVGGPLVWFCFGVGGEDFGGELGGCSDAPSRLYQHLFIVSSQQLPGCSSYMTLL